MSKPKNMTEQQVYALALDTANKLAPPQGVDPVQLARTATAIAWVESSYNPNARNRRSTARGLMQMLIGTQREIETKFLKKKHEPNRIFDPAYAMLLAQTYILYQYERYNNDWTKAVHAYNQGSFPGTKPRDGANYAGKWGIAINAQNTTSQNLAQNNRQKFNLEFL